MPKPYILFCAGEDSGDILGEGFVAAAQARGLETRGTGGARMQAAGLIPIADFEHLPVSGFLDVLPKYLELRHCYNLLEQALISEDCVGFVAIDYPGFNMKLCALANKLGKKVLYVAPPQIWAWKRNRAQKLRDVDLAVLFEFEKETYEKLGCRTTLLTHPFLKMEDRVSPPLPLSGKILLLPGSRKKQALRNLRHYLDLVWDFGCNVEIVAARNSLVKLFEQELQRNFNERNPSIRITCAPQNVQERRNYFASASLAISTPGTATIELALSGIPLIVSMVPDRLTYFLGKKLVHTKLFAMPNILLGQMEIPEYIYPSGQSQVYLQKVKGKMFEMMSLFYRENAERLACQLKKMLGGGQSAAELFSKFF